MLEILVAADKIKAKYQNANSSSNQKKWQRLCFVPQLIKGDSLLDIGTGDGSFANLISDLNIVKRIVTVDEKKHSKLQILSDDIVFEKRSFRSLRFKTNEFETVVCMETLEHLGLQRNNDARSWLGWDLGNFYDVLNEARRICKKRLIMTIPFSEEFPIYKHDQASGHKQIFNPNKIISLFPTAKFVNLHHWLFVIEDKPIHREFHLSPIGKLLP